MLRMLLVLSVCLLWRDCALAEGPSRRDLLGDPIPEKAVLRLGTIRFRQSNTIHALAMSPDGKVIVSGGYNNKLLFWDVDSGKLLREQSLTFSLVRGLRFSQDGKLLAIGGGDGVVYLFDASTGKQLRTLQDPTNQRRDRVHIELSPDGKTLAMNYWNEPHLLLWNVTTGKLMHRLSIPASYYEPPLVFTPDSKQLITLWNDSRLHLIDRNTGRSLRCLEPQTPPSTSKRYSSRFPSLVLTPDGKTLVYCKSGDRHFHLVDVATTREIRRLAIKGSKYYSSRSGDLIIPESGRFLYEATGENAIRIWGLTSGKMIRNLTTRAGNVRQLCASLDGKRVASFSGNVITVWEVESGKIVHDGQGHNTRVSQVLFSPDGKRIISAGEQRLRVWDAVTGRQLNVQRTATGGNSMFHTQFTSGNKILEWVGGDRVRYRWDITTNKDPVRLSSPRYRSYSSAQGLSPDGKWVAAINSSDRKLQLFDLTGKSPPRELATLVDAYSNSLTYSPDGRWLVLAARDRTVTFFRADTGQVMRKWISELMQAGDTSTPRVQFGSDSHAMLLHDGQLHLVETVTGTARMWVPRASEQSVTALAMSDDSRLVACGYADGLVVVYDTWNERQVLRQSSDQGAIHSLAFSRDNRRLASGGMNTTVLVWDLPELGELTGLSSSSDEKTWRDLGEIDGRRAFRSMRRLIANPSVAIALIRDRCKPPAAVDPTLLARWIAELDHDSYRVREQAQQQLEAVGRPAIPPLQKALKSPSLEVRRRAEDLLRRLGEESVASPGFRRWCRAIEVLERIATPAARETLRSMRKSTSNPLLTVAIEDALKRLEG